MNKPPMPEQPKTKPEMPAVVPQVPATLDAVLREVRDTRKAVTAVVDQVSELNERVRQVEVAVEQANARANIQSIKVRGTSENDMRQDAAIAHVVTRVDVIEKNQATAAAERAETAANVVKILNKLFETTGSLAKFAKHPLVVALAVAAAGFLISWFKGHTP